MTKNFKLVLAMVLSLMMVLSSVAMAEVPTSQTIANGNAPDATTGKYTISVPSGDTHNYEVYQIITGTLIAGETKLGNPAWGSSVGTTEAAADVKDFIENIKNLSGPALVDAVKAKATASSIGQVDASTSLDVVPGYYMLVDVTDPLDEGDAKSLNIIAVFNDIEIAAKRSTTESDKKVDDNDTDKAADGSEWIDSADYNIGDTVPYKLSATIAEDYANYTKGYKLSFHDDMGPGLTFGGSVTVKVDGAKIDSGYTLVTTGLTDNCEFEVRFANLKDIAAVHAGSVITVEFNAILNDQAVMTNAGNPNKSWVTYTNNPNDDQAGENGKTPDDTVIVFTYKTVFTKKDGAGKTLTGADFTLEKKVGTEWVNVTALHEGTDAKNPTKTGDSSGFTFTFAGLDAGDYKLTETETPTGYNTIDPIEFTITATHDIESDNPTLTALTGTDGAEFNMTPVLASGELDADVINEQGAALPSTGGIGTTIFYVAGSIMVLAAAILLITKRRMGAND